MLKLSKITLLALFLLSTAGATEAPLPPPEYQIPLHYLAADEAARMLQQLYPGTTTRSFRGKLFARCSRQSLNTIEEFLDQLDTPPRSPSTRFIELRHEKPHRIALLLQARFADNPQVTILPDNRTNRIFLMAPPVLLNLLQNTIRDLDAPDA
ncbi:MAG: hypothetical protein O3A92_04580 [Verrucomicrobia bacterium]|nr:hypothetical protein [Verrucomicrobiota bacterium]